MRDAYFALIAAIADAAAAAASRADAYAATRFAAYIDD